MSIRDGRLRVWLPHALALLAVALTFHVATVWSLPRLIMNRLMHRIDSRVAQSAGRELFPEATTATSRDVVMPSPDMLYSVCTFDLTAGPVRIKTRPQLKSYWSIALYAANSDNFLVVSDRLVGEAPVDLWLVSDTQVNQDVPPGARVVMSPSNKGLLLMRVLTGNYAAEAPYLEPARRTLKCDHP